jgi:hypothetical protein
MMPALAEGILKRDVSSVELIHYRDLCVDDGYAP